MPYLKSKCPSVVKAHYSTDGCGGQYKNKYNFINLCCHKKDFNIQAGKSAYDGIGGTVKRLTRKASLQRPVTNQILTLEAMYSFCVEKFQALSL